MLKRKEKKMGVTTVTAIGQKDNKDFKSEINNGTCCFTKIYRVQNRQNS